jgi:hypothetical protein
MFTHVETVTFDRYGNTVTKVTEGSLAAIVGEILERDPGSLLSARYIR